ncbi:MAG: hypothetical protein J3K34DRAFT_405360 [Monoraphidium minutum]|nr:MAG: hypothetical protein J3K34DRAFT_405360 [Monoraphidium minutum]
MRTRPFPGAPAPGASLRSRPALRTRLPRVANAAPTEKPPTGGPCILRSKQHLPRGPPRPARPACCLNARPAPRRAPARRPCRPPRNHKARGRRPAGHALARGPLRNAHRWAGPRCPPPACFRVSVEACRHARKRKHVPANPSGTLWRRLGRASFSAAAPRFWNAPTHAAARRAAPARARTTGPLICIRV